MAIKGKKKPRGGAPRGAPLAPKPRVEARKPPLARRTWFKRTFAVAVALLVLFTLLTVMGRMHRADAVRDYDKKLSNAERPFRASTEQGEHSISSVATAFASGGVTPKQLKDEAKTWEDNFKKAATAVRALKPPKELEAAGQMSAAALDDYAGVARFYVVVAQERELQDATKDKALKTKIKDQVDLLLTHIQDMKNRADSLMQLAKQQVDDLKRRWGVKVTAPPAPATNPSGAIPGGAVPGGAIPGGAIPGGAVPNGGAPITIPS